MNKIVLPSGTYAVDDILQGFDIIEKPSSNVAFVGTCMITHQMYVQFKNGSGYMYNEVDYDVLSAVSAVDSIGKFISSQVVKKFESEKLPNALIVHYDDLFGFPAPILITGDIKDFPVKSEAGIIFQTSCDAKVEYIEPYPADTNEPEF